MAHLQLTPEGLPEREIFNGNIHWDENHFCRVDALSPEEIEYFRVVPLLETPVPMYNTNTQLCERIGVEYSEATGWQYKWVVTELSSADIAQKLEQAKINKNLQINEWRALANQTSFIHNDKEIACDALSRSDIDGVAGHIALTGTLPTGFPNVWKATDNTYITISNIDDFKAMYSSMTAQGTANFMHSEELKLVVRNATSVDELDSVVW